VDSDQAHVAPHNRLTSMAKHVDVAVYQAVKDVLEGRFAGGDVALGLKEGGLTLAPLGPMVAPAEAKAALKEADRLREEIVAGRLEVPATLEQLAKFAAAHP